MQFIRIAALPLCLAVSPAAAQVQNPLADAKGGVLTLKVEIEGAGRFKSKLESSWESAQISHGLTAEVPLALIAKTGNTDMARNIQDTEGMFGKQDPNQVQRDLQKCGNDASCVMAIMKTVPIANGSNRGGGDRFQNFHHKPGSSQCGKGTLSASDKGEGLAMGEAGPDIAYRYTLTGKAEPGPDDGKFCNIGLTIDTKSGTYSLSLPLNGLDMKGRMDLSAKAFNAGERSIDLVPGRGKRTQLLVENVPLVAGAKVLEGTQRIDNVGAAPFGHPGIHDLIPLNATVSWRFEAK